MEYSLKQAFHHREVKDVRIFLKEASFYLGSLKTEVRIRLYMRPEDESSIYYEQSHQIQTPMQTERPRSGMNFAHSEEEAFYEAIGDLTDAYDVAVMAGHRPRADWLVPNEYF
jgi:hypothetical protein